MAGQEQQRPQRREDEDTPPPSPPTPSAPRQQDSASTAEVDDLLAEIDGVLETNAEEFVHGFVQKGGQ